MCRLRVPGSIDDTSCIICKLTAQRRCNHELLICCNKEIHPRWDVIYYKMAPELSTFEGCGFCKYAHKMNEIKPAATLADNPGWPGCCYPPLSPRYFSWIPSNDWQLLSKYHNMPIPAGIVHNTNKVPQVKGTKSRDKTSTADRHQSTGPEYNQQTALAIPNKAGGSPRRRINALQLHSLPHSTSSAIPIQSQIREHTPPRGGSFSSRDSNSSGSPPIGSRRKDETPESVLSRSNPSPIHPARPNDEYRLLGTNAPQSRDRRGGSPIHRDKSRDRDSRDREVVVSSKRKSIPQPQQLPQQQSVSGSPIERQREKEAIHARSKPSPPVSTNSHSNVASSSSRRTSPVEATVPAHQQIPSPPRSNRSNVQPSISSVISGMGNVSIGSVAPTRTHAEILASRIPSTSPPSKAMSVVGSSSSSSTSSSSTREGTVVSDGAFTDYLSDDSDLELTRQAEEDHKKQYEIALRKHEEMEFREARDSLSRVQITFSDTSSSSSNYHPRRATVMSNSAPRVRVG